jgi:hypothetical protein
MHPFDMVIHPTLKVTYVTIGDRTDNGPHSHVLVVDEATGAVHQPDNAVGNFIAIDAAGAKLYTGYKDIYVKGQTLFVNPDGNIWDTPQYGNIDILMIYNLADPNHPKLDAVRDKVGGNGSGIRLSPDGKRVSYLSFTGFPEFSKCVPAWSPTDMDALPVTYDCAGKANNQLMNYHQSLPLVIIPGNTGPLIFDRESGDISPDRIHIPDDMFKTTKLLDVYFSPDGKSAILKCQNGTKYWLAKAPLKLSDDELQIVRKGVVPPPITKPPVDGAGSGGSKA